MKVNGQHVELVKLCNPCTTTSLSPSDELAVSVKRVLEDIECHIHKYFLGVEGAESSPVCHWHRTLQDALDVYYKVQK